MTLMERRRALMAGKSNILFSWEPMDGLTGIQITGDASTRYQLLNTGLRLFGYDHFQITQIEIPNVQQSESFSIKIVVDLSSIYYNCECLISTRFMGAESRINYVPYSNVIRITNEPDYPTALLTGVHEFSCKYDGKLKTATWKLDGSEIGTTQNVSIGTNKIAVWYAPLRYAADKYLDVKEIMVYKET